MAESILVDSSFLAALYNPTDPNHRRAAHFVRLDKSPRLIPEVSLPEVTFLRHRAGGVPAVGSFLNALITTHPTLQTLAWDDMVRARAILLTCASAEFDLVDCCIMALSEHLNVKRVATFDRRDFSMFRPAHCEYLELLP